MGYKDKDEILERTPKSNLTAFLQVSGWSCTNPRDAIGQIFESHRWKACTVQEIAREAKIPRRSIYDTLKILLKKRLVHFSPSLRAYFWCQKSSAKQAHLPVNCHSFAICKKCKRVDEFIHGKHSHPNLKSIKDLSREHEWVGLCRTCA